MISTDAGREFVSIIDVYSEYLNEQEGFELVDAWVEAIRSLTLDPPQIKSRQLHDDHSRNSIKESGNSGNFIVLNGNVYDSLYERVTMAYATSVEEGSRSSAANTIKSIKLPLMAFFHLPTDSIIVSDIDLADASIEALVSRTLDRVNDSLRRKLSKCVLAILPFSRPYRDATEFYAQSADGREDVKDGELLSIYPDSARDPGGCFFGIYYAEGLPPERVNDNERRLYLQLQYLLTLSALVEARKNLVLYYDDQLLRDWESIAHQIKNGLEVPHGVVETLTRDPKHASSELLFVRDRLDRLLNAAKLTTKAVKARTQTTRTQALNEAASLGTMLQELSGTLMSYSKIVAEDDAYRHKKKKPLLIDLKLSTLAEMVSSKLLDGNTQVESGDRRLAKWIGSFHIIVCQELCNNIAQYARRSGQDEENIVGRWTLTVHHSVVRLIVENEVNPEDEDQVAKVRELARRGKNFRFSTGLGQMRLGMSVQSDLPDLDLGVVEPDASKIFFQIAIPLGVLEPS